MSNLNHVNMTTTQTMEKGLQQIANEKLLWDMQPNLVHQQFGQKITLEKNTGATTVRMRRYNPFPPSTRPLQEGVIPEGQMLSMMDIFTTLQPFGEYVKITDYLDMLHMDKPMRDAVRLLADQASLSADRVCRNELVTGTSVLYSGGKTARHLLTPDDELSILDIRRAVRALEKAKAKKIGNNYVGIIGPDAKFSLQNDPLWIDVAKYQEKAHIYNGEVGQLFGVRFVQTTEAAVLEAKPMTAEALTLTVKSYAGKVVTVEEAMTAEDAAALKDRPILIDNVKYFVTAATAGAAGAATITLDNEYDPTNLPAAADTICGGEGGSNGTGVLQTIILGQDAYGTTQFTKGGTPRVIIKPMGSAGTADPLDQFGTVGYKIDGFGCKILNNAWMVRIESGMAL